MMNRVKINGCWAAVYYDPKHDMFRGEFVKLSSRVVFSSRDIGGLLRQGEVALDAFFDKCRANGTEPQQAYSGELVLRIHPGLHAELAARAFASGKTVNQWLAELIEQAVCGY